MPARLAARLRAALHGRSEAVWLGVAALALVAGFFHPSVPMQRNQLEFIAVLDVTQSMDVPDQTEGGKHVSRLVHAKHALSRALAGLPCGSKVGLGFFTEYRSFLMTTPIEVCENQRVLQQSLARIDGRMAWAGSSEIAKGLNSGMEISATLESHPALLFMTDGHEAPPVNPSYRPKFTVARGSVHGLIAGVGGDVLMPIPKTDPEGNPRGVWAANEVLQIDPRSMGRGGSVKGEQMVDPNEHDVPPLPGATPGREHLSSLREDYLRLLASETGLGYMRLDNAAQLKRALLDKRMTHPVASKLDLREPLAGLALLALLWPVALRLLRSMKPRVDMSKAPQVLEAGRSAIGARRTHPATAKPSGFS